jgi:hypothetical protein
MTTLTLVLDERELSTIRAALLLLLEQVNALPEDLAEMLGEHGPAMSEAEIDHLSSRLAERQEPAPIYARHTPYHIDARRG